MAKKTRLGESMLPQRGAFPRAWPGPGTNRLATGGWRVARRSLLLGVQFLILWLFFVAGTVLVDEVSLHLPGNLVGMLLLLIFLETGLLPPHFVQDMATLVVRHLAFFFIPLAVGLMSWQALLATSGLVLGSSLLGSAVVGIAAAGIVAQLLARGGGSE